MPSGIARDGSRPRSRDDPVKTTADGRSGTGKAQARTGLRADAGALRDTRRSVEPSAAIP
jgi:hypothetical protein